MAGYVCLGAAAAFGVLSAIWVLFGWLLPGGTGGALVCRCRPGLKEMPLIRRHRWLRELGLLRVPMLLVDSSFSQEERQFLRRRYSGIDFCSLEELPARLEVERNRIERPNT